MHEDLEPKPGRGTNSFLSISCTSLHPVHLSESYSVSKTWESGVLVRLRGDARQEMIKNSHYKRGTKNRNVWDMDIDINLLSIFTSIKE